MTAPLLLAYICAALMFQLAVGIGVAMWRRRAVAARTPLAPDLQAVQLAVGAWPGWRAFRVARREFEDLTQTQCSFYLEPLDGVALPPFKPGQFLTLTLQIASAAGPRTITRCYSLSDQPEPMRYRITVKRVNAPAERPDLPPGAASGHLHDQIREGDVLQVKAPSGHFFIDPDPTVPLVLIAGGIGITPLLSMLHWCLAEQPGRRVHLYYGLRHSGEHAFKLQLEQLASAHPHFHLRVLYSRPLPKDVPGRDYHHARHIDIGLLQRTLPQERHQFYVCGPAAMMESLVPALVRWGVPQQDIHFEAFGPASVRLPDAAPQAQPAGQATTLAVHFRRTGRTLVWDGQDASLLELAERHDLAVESGCCLGACGVCETKLISGTVRYANPPEHDVAPGHCLLCVGVPESALEIEA